MHSKCQYIQGIARQSCLRNTHTHTKTHRILVESGEFTVLLEILFCIEPTIKWLTLNFWFSFQNCQYWQQMFTICMLWKHYCTVSPYCFIKFIKFHRQPAHTVANQNSNAYTNMYIDFLAAQWFRSCSHLYIHENTLYRFIDLLFQGRAHHPDNRYKQHTTLSTTTNSFRIT